MKSEKVDKQKKEEIEKGENLKQQEIGKKVIGKSGKSEKVGNRVKQKIRKGKKLEKVGNW